MSGEHETSAPSRVATGELVIPALALLFTLYYFYSVHDAPWTAKVSTYFVGGVLIGLVVLFAARFAGHARRAGWRPSRLLEPLEFLPRRLALLALTVAYVALLDWAGFTIGTFAFLLAAMLILGGRRRLGHVLALAALSSLGGYVLFIAIFATRFPAGPFERLMQDLIG